MNLSYRINKPVDLVFEYLADMQKFVSVHPVITKIDKTGENTYQAHETLKFLFIPVSFSSPVTVESKPLEKIVTIRATVMTYTKIEMTFVLRADQDYTVIDETVNFKSPLPFKFMMKRIFRKQHRKLFRNIEMVKLDC
jgi:carbon monoxide dehydrogenase subunit G